MTVWIVGGVAAALAAVAGWRAGQAQWDGFALIVAVVASLLLLRNLTDIAIPGTYYIGPFLLCTLLGGFRRRDPGKPTNTQGR